ncbi:hypothetical protein CONLIGDRAFT_685764 [Coniochaeta ligniaria NRRL 30616]|uniref:Uncharacterized protein n=1 Tax=Coniochaeta ligniaria NRRL 30616 TaxID=1408157 RepID=A0A1J7J4R6_9PEZI|nr:hypothetical protein CONLIGDRAFT_685764 [Coniochaeta ligniaria NRRL 30616]
MEGMERHWSLHTIIMVTSLRSVKGRAESVSEELRKETLLLAHERVAMLPSKLSVPGKQQHDRTSLRVEQFALLSVTIAMSSIRIRLRSRPRLPSRYHIPSAKRQRMDGSFQRICHHRDPVAMDVVPTLDPVSRHKEDEQAKREEEHKEQEDHEEEGEYKEEAPKRREPHR